MKPEERVRVLQLEIDYHLTSLFDAMETGNKHEIDEEKRKLHELQYKLNRAQKNLMVTS